MLLLVEFSLFQGWRQLYKSWWADVVETVIQKSGLYCIFFMAHEPDLLGERVSSKWTSHEFCILGASMTKPGSVQCTQYDVRYSSNFSPFQEPVQMKDSRAKTL